jgi:hypothetical protein
VEILPACFAEIVLRTWITSSLLAPLQKGSRGNYGVVFGSRYLTNWDDLLGWELGILKGRALESHCARFHGGLW